MSESPVEMIEEWREVEARARAENLNGGLTDATASERLALAQRLIGSDFDGEQLDADGLAEALAAARQTLDVAEGGVGKVRATGEPRSKLTDLGNAERFAEDHADELRFVPGIGWHTWDGARWSLDRTGEAMRRAKRTARSIHVEAAEISSDDERKRVSRHALASERRPRLEAMVKLAESDLPLIANVEQLDADPMLLNVENATIDLGTGRPRPHDRGDLITRVAPVRFDLAARCPTWMDCLDTWTGDGVETGYLQRAVGYSLTGATSEQCLFLLDGEGANGKTTFLETIGALCGDYSASAAAATFMASGGSSVRSDLARLRGRRFVRAAEVEEGDRFAEVLIKQLTGGDTVVARFLYRDEFEFRPAFKLWIAANRLPEIRGTDHAIWRRIRRVPFPTKITRPDRQLPARLRAELPGILNWAIEGAVAWGAEGLGVPDTVRSATQDYRREQDSVGEFIEARCELAPDAEATPTELRDSYEEFCAAAGVDPVTPQAFRASLVSRGLSRGRRREGRFWSGIGVTR